MMIIINLKTNRKTSSSGGDKKRSSALRKKLKASRSQKISSEAGETLKTREIATRKTFEDGNLETRSHENRVIW